MPEKYFIVSLLTFLSFDFIQAKDILNCKVITGKRTECNQYGSKLLTAKKVDYEKDTKKLIISKTLPKPKKTEIKLMSVAEMIEQYVKVEDSLRFKGMDTSPLNVHVIKEPVPKEVIQKVIDNIKKKQRENTSRHIERTIDSSSSKTHTLQSLKKKTHALERNVGFYKIVSGDTLSHLVNKFRISKKKLLALNNMTMDACLKIGEKFRIPLTQKMIDSIIAAEYIIGSGDTLLSIARKFKIEPKDLVRFNHIKSNTLLKKGNKIKLPLPYVLKKIEIEKKKLLKKKKLEKERLARLRAKKKRVKMIRGFGRHKLRVTATAYSSHRNQTDSTPFIAAWNNRLRPGMKIIAVSRDLITRYGLRNGTKVRIGGLPGYYRVRDKMNKRYRRRIDIYTGLNRRRALRWGRRSVNIYW